MEVRVRTFVAFSWWSKHIARNGCIFLAHENLKPRAGPRKVFTHSSRRVSFDHCLNASIFERAPSQVRLSAATERLDDNQFSVLHSGIICPDERERWLRHPSGFSAYAANPSFAAFLNHLHVRVAGIGEEFAMLINTQ